MKPTQVQFKRVVNYGNYRTDSHRFICLNNWTPLFHRGFQLFKGKEKGRPGNQKIVKEQSPTILILVTFHNAFCYKLCTIGSLGTPYTLSSSLRV